MMVLVRIRDEFRLRVAAAMLAVANGRLKNHSRQIHG